MLSFEIKIFLYTLSITLLLVPTTRAQTTSEAPTVAPTNSPTAEGACFICGQGIKFENPEEEATILSGAFEFPDEISTCGDLEEYAEDGFLNEDECDETKSNLGFISCRCPGDSDFINDILGGFDFCFSRNMEVVVQGKGIVPMEALQVGDYVKIGNVEAYEQVYAFGHRVPQKYTEFVQLHTNTGTPPLEMTGQHLVFVDGKTNPVRADSIKVGDLLQAEGKNAVVEKIEFVTRNGIYNPLTSSGTIQVNGITASNYVSFQKENNEFLELPGGVEIPMSHHDFAHRAMTPFRFYCSTLTVCDVNDVDSGLPAYVSMGIDLIKWGQQQHVAVQLSFWVLYRMLILASIFMVCMVLMIPAYMISGSSVSQLKRIVSHVRSFGVHTKMEMKKKH